MKKLLLSLGLSVSFLLACDCTIPRTWYYDFKGDVGMCISNFKKVMKNEKILFEKIDYEANHSSVIFRSNDITISNICDGRKNFAYIIVSGCNIEKENKILLKIKKQLLK